MQVKVSEWGNSKAVRLSKDMVEFLSAKTGGFIEVEFLKEGLLFKPATENAAEYSLDQLLDGSPEGSFDLDDDDRAWLDTEPAGSEFT